MRLRQDSALPRPGGSHLMTEDLQQGSAVGALLAFALGDALGWPVEMRGNRVGGMSGLEPELALRSWVRREGGRYAPHEEAMPRGVYSDDTQLTLAVARSLRLPDWWKHLTEVELPWWPHYELGGGGATRRAAKAWGQKQPPWTEHGAKGYWTAGGNGAAMRVLAHCAQDDSAFAVVRERVLADGATTHGDPVALVGAQLYAYALWKCFRYSEPLGWGQLIQEALEGREQWTMLDQRAVPGAWSEHLPNNYESRWESTVSTVIDKLQFSQDNLSQGALAVDDHVLAELGCFSRESGAGTVTAVGALYLASRHAAEPDQAVLRAAFARGADTDTLAAMTGALLGAVHGADWIRGAADGLMDRDLLVRTGSELGHASELKESTPYDAEAQRIVDGRLADAAPGSELDVPFYGQIVLREIRDLDNRKSWIRSWWFTNAQGQTFRVKKVSRAKQAPWRSLSPPASDTGNNGRKPSGIRSGLVIRTNDLDETRSFYEEVLGLEITKRTATAVVFAGWLAIEEAEPEMQMQLDVGTTVAASVSLYADGGEYERLHERLDRKGVDLTRLDDEGASVIRTRDPNGVPVEIRLRPTDKSSTPPS